MGRAELPDLRQVARRIARDLVAGHRPLVYPPLAGPAEIARMFGTSTATVHHWAALDLLPDPAWRVSGVPLYRIAHLYDWAELTGRTIVWHPWQPPPKESTPCGSASTTTSSTTPT